MARLQRIGYRYIALGGMVPLKTEKIMDCLLAIDGVRDRNTQLHLLGISRYDNAAGFTKYGVTSFDSTSPFRQAFKDDRTASVSERVEVPPSGPSLQRTPARQHSRFCSNRPAPDLTTRSAPT